MSITHDDLRQFTGSEEFYRHGLMRKVAFTEGVKFLVDKASAYWLLDKVATLQMNRKVRAEEFQVWKLELKDKRPVMERESNTAKLSCEDGNGNQVYRETIAFTDFPLDSIELWVEGGPEQPVVLLPSEH